MSGSDEPWDRFRIRGEVHRRGSTLTEIANKAGIAESSCRMALTGGSRPGALALSRFLGVPMKDLFPGLYLRARTNPAKSNAKAVGESRKKRKTPVDGAAVSS